MTSIQNKYKCAVFDLDGTLVNTIEDLKNACDYVIKKHNFDASWTARDYKKMVGNGMRLLIIRAFKNTLSEEETEHRLTEFKKRYNAHILDCSRPYDGIKEQLEILKKRGVRLAVVTNKADDSAKLIVKSLFGDELFDAVIGQRDGLPTKPDPQGVYIALEAMSCKKDEAVYFGDSDIDIITAKNAGVKASVGAAWGFRGYDELKKQNPDFIINNPNEISNLF